MARSKSVQGAKCIVTSLRPLGIVPALHPEIQARLPTPFFALPGPKSVENFFWTLFVIYGIIESEKANFSVNSVPEKQTGGAKTMYAFVRLLFSGVCLLVGGLLIRRFCTQHKKKLYAALVAGSLVLGVCGMFLPVENYVVTFHSPESAFQYYTGTQNVQLVVPGNESDLVIGSRGETDILLIVPKTDNGWKIGISANTKRIHQTVCDDAVIQLCQYGDTDDYFLLLISLSREPLTIADSLNSTFYLGTYTNGQAEDDHSIYYAHIVRPDRYWLSVNDTVVQLDKAGQTD